MTPFPVYWPGKDVIFMAKAIVGGNWGDEGKGKITDLLAGGADMVVRYQGGANAGHTVINEYGKFALHILPSGVFRAGVVNLIGPGAAFDPVSFFGELAALEKGGVPAPRVLVSERAQLVMPYHILFDEWEEARLGKMSFGSTKSGIAPFYADKSLKVGFQLAELYEGDFSEKLRRVAETKAVQSRALYGDVAFPTVETLEAYVASFREKLRPHVVDARRLLSDARRSGKRILLEGQLGALRDPDNGIYPFVTSSSPLAGFAAVGAGIPAREIAEVVAVVKAYSSCVGAGAFTTEIFGPAADELRGRGGDCGEFGAKTGRPRRMGWFDAVATRYGVEVQGATEVALSLIDVLGYLDEIPVCVAYEIDGEQTADFPATPKLNRAKPVYARLPGWKRDIRDVRRYADLPDEAKNYVDFIEKQLECPIKMVSNGPAREAILYR